MLFLGEVLLTLAPCGWQHAGCAGGAMRRHRHMSNGRKCSPPPQQVQDTCPPDTITHITTLTKRDIQIAAKYKLPKLLSHIQPNHTASDVPLLPQHFSTDTFTYLTSTSRFKFPIMSNSSYLQPHTNPDSLQHVSLIPTSTRLHCIRRVLIPITR